MSDVLCEDAIGCVVDTQPMVWPDNDPVCYEDMACWDCATMGNLVCGPETTVTVPQVDPLSVEIPGCTTVCQSAPKPTPTLPATGDAFEPFLVLAVLFTTVGLILRQAGRPYRERKFKRGD